MEIKTRESFLKEVNDYMSQTDSNILEAILWYCELYSIDYEYMTENLMSQSIMERLQDYCDEMNLIKKNEIEGFDL